MATRKKPSEREAERLANEAAINRAYGCKPRPRYRDDPAAWPAEKKRTGKDAWRTYYGYRYQPGRHDAEGSKFPPAAVAAALVAHEERGHERTAWQPSAHERVAYEALGKPVPPAKPEPMRAANGRVLTRAEQAQARKAAVAESRADGYVKWPEPTSAGALAEPTAPAGDKWPWIAVAEKAGKLVAYTAESERAGRRLRAVLYVGEGVCEVHEERERGGPWRKLDTHTAAYAAGSAALWEVKRADTAREAVAAGVGRMRPAVEILREEEERAAAAEAAEHQRAQVAAIRASRERQSLETVAGKPRHSVAYIDRPAVCTIDPTLTQADVEPAETPDLAPGTAWQRVELPAPAMPGPLAPASDLELCASVLRSLADAYGPRRAHKLRAMADFVESHGQPRLRQAAE
jgi:hypothetical protein